MLLLLYHMLLLLLCHMLLLLLYHMLLLCYMLSVRRSFCAVSRV